MTKEKINSRESEPSKTHVIIRLTEGFRKNPICPMHKKRAIICEPFDEIGLRRWFCIDCICNAIYGKKGKKELLK